MLVRHKWRRYNTCDAMQTMHLGYYWYALERIGENHNSKEWVGVQRIRPGCLLEALGGWWWVG